MGGHIVHKRCKLKAQANEHQNIIGIQKCLQCSQPCHLIEPHLTLDDESSCCICNEKLKPTDNIYVYACCDTCVHYGCQFKHHLYTRKCPGKMYLETTKKWMKCTNKEIKEQSYFKKIRINGELRLANLKYLEYNAARSNYGTREKIRYKKRVNQGKK